MSRKSHQLVLLAIYGIFSACLIAFSGCQQGMALDAGPKSMNLKKDSIGIFTLRTVNQFNPSYQPEATFIVVISQTDKKKAINFNVGRPCSKKKNEFFEYIISLRLAAGSYRLDGRVGSDLAYVPAGVHGESSVWPLIRGVFSFPIEAGFDLPPNVVVYLGHVDMVNRKAKEGERRSGGIFPLIDQAVTGFHEGTFDVTIADRSETDIPLITKTYPFLEKHTITKAIMTK